MCALSFAFAYTDGRHITQSITRPAGAQAPHLTVPRPAASATSKPDWRGKQGDIHVHRQAPQAPLPTVIAVIVLLAVWETWVDLGHVSPTMISAPSEIFAATIETWNTLGPAAAITGYEGVVGFLFAVFFGIMIGIALYCSHTFNAAFYPLFAAAQTMPLISIAPLFLIWFGFEISGKIVIVAVFGLFPIAVQTVRGLEAVPQFYSDVALTCGATPVWTLWHVKLRVAARQIYGGIRVSAAYIFATASTAEYLGARKGLGIWLQAAYNSFRTPLIFSATIVIILMTCVLMLAVNASERILLGPAGDDEDPDADQ